jgi:serine/threonine-protein kinase RsbT
VIRSSEVRLPVATEMEVTRCVIAAGNFAVQTGFDEARGRMIATAVSELARNIVKYAGKGELRLRRVERALERGVEIEAVDRGPGIVDAERAMSDHYSSGGTLGLGLPGVKRLMDEFELETASGAGTRVTARKWI